MANVAKGHPIHDFKASVRHAFMDAYDDGAPMQGALTMLMVFVMPRPQAKIWKTRPMPREPYTASMNDWDNLGKGVSDALLGLAYRDDGQLSDVTVSRRIAAGDEMPHVEVEIRETE
jgi:Holliday junction resolvase RusA-like endonuclease